MERVYRKRLEEPDEVIPFDHGRAELVRIGDLTVGREILEPGWRWSEHVKPLVRTEWCQTHHLSLTLAGRSRIRLADGTEFEIGPGDLADIPPGHDAWVVGDEASISFDFGGLRSWLPSALDEGERVLSTVLFTDIVDSTAQLERLGDRTWRRLLADHDELVRRVLDEFRGWIVKTTGDGILATFDGPARAIRAAAAIRGGLTDLGISVRAAVHTGEVELADGDLRGVAVHEAARLMGLAGPGEILVSGTTHDLVAGSNLALEERGRQELKGLTGSRIVYAFTGSEEGGRG